MKIFIWQRIEHCSGNYHEEGGVAVVADNLDRAIRIAIEKGCKFLPEEKPDYEEEIIAHDEKVFIFPDTGCC
jgi:hypothetical protein